MSIYRTRTYIAADFDNDRDAVVNANIKVSHLGSKCS